MCEECVEAKGCRKNMRVIFVEKSDLIGRVGYVRHRAASVQGLLRDDGFVAVRSGIRVAPCLRDGGEWRVSAFVWLQNETHGTVHNRIRSYLFKRDAPMATFNNIRTHAREKTKEENTNGS